MPSLSQRYRFLLVFVLLFPLLLSACQLQSSVAVAPDYAAIEEAVRLPRGKPLQMTGGVQDAEVRYGRVGEIAYLELQRLDPPAGFYPLGMIDTRYGYLIEQKQPQVLWLFDYQQQSWQELVDYRGQSLSLGLEIAFNENWLVWLEIEPYLQQENGLRQRQIRLKARNLLHPGREDIVIDEGSTTPAEGFYLPFDYLGLDDSTLVYRCSIFSGGWRDTRVKLRQLDSSETKTLGAASGAAGRQITRCSIGGQLVAWDVQLNYQEQVAGLPVLQRARYSLCTYQLDRSKLASGADPETNLTLNDEYYAPVVYRDQLLVLRQFPIRQDWRVINDVPRIFLDNSQTYSNAIVQINPQYKSAQILVQNSGYSQRRLEEFSRLDIPYTVQRHDIRIGKRLLSWRSNLGEQNIVFDLSSYCFLELPVFFQGLSDEQPQGFWSRFIPGLDADYLLFGLISEAEPPYILRLS